MERSSKSSSRDREQRDQAGDAGIHALWQHHAAMSELVARIRADVDLSANEMTAVVLLWTHGRLSMGQLSRRIPLSRAATTLLVDRLVGDVGYLRRVPHETDRRQVCIELTEKLTTNRGRFGAWWHVQVRAYLGGLPAGELQVLLDALDHLRQVTVAENEALLGGHERSAKSLLEGLDWSGIDADPAPPRSRPARGS